MLLRLPLAICLGGIAIRMFMDDEAWVDRVIVFI